MAGADIQIIARFGAADSTRVKWHGGVGAAQACLPQAFPVLGVFYHAHNFPVVVLGGIFLSKNQEIILFPSIKTAPYGQFHGNRAVCAQVEIVVIIFHYDLPVDILYPCYAPDLVFIQIGLDSLCPVPVIVAIPTVVLCVPVVGNHRGEIGRYDRGGNVS